MFPLLSILLFSSQTRLQGGTPGVTIIHDFLTWFGGKYVRLFSPFIGSHLEKPGNLQLTKLLPTLCEFFTICIICAFVLLGIGLNFFRNFGLSLKSKKYYINVKMVFSVNNLTSHYLRSHCFLMLKELKMHSHYSLCHQHMRAYPHRPAYAPKR